jgi:hypothetical protein
VEVCAVSEVGFGAGNIRTCDEGRKDGRGGQRSRDGGDLYNFLFTSLLMLSQKLYRVYFKDVDNPSL